MIIEYIWEKYELIQIHEYEITTWKQYTTNYTLGSSNDKISVATDYLFNNATGTITLENPVTIALSKYDTYYNNNYKYIISSSSSLPNDAKNNVIYVTNYSKQTVSMSYTKHSIKFNVPTIS
jgi:hypothetical protein